MSKAGVKHVYIYTHTAREVIVEQEQIYNSIYIYNYIYA
jgi:hypothetical protein